MEMWISHAAPPGTPSVAAVPSVLAEYVLFPFYDWMVAFFPVSWMPNKVTLAGILFTVTASLLLLSSMPAGTRFEPGRMELLPASLAVKPMLPPPPLSPTEMAPILPHTSPSLLLLLCGALNLLYCIADNTDGRLARRDKKTSAIGEYLDHGLDCVTSLLSTCCVFALLGSLCNMTISVCLIAFVTVLSHTLHYETNIFIWGNRFATVDEAMLFFGIGLWWPLVCPDVGTAVVPAWMLELIFGEGSEWVTRLRPLRLMDLVYVLYSAAQAQTIVSVASRRWGMLCRMHVLFSILNAVVLLVLMETHSEHVSAAAPATSVPGYTLGPFTYPAIWIITAACTSSIIIHIPIMARCARLRVVDPSPLAGVMLVWSVFVHCPVGAAILAVILHLGQLLWNVQYIEKRRHRVKSVTDDALAKEVIADEAHISEKLTI